MIYIFMRPWKVVLKNVNFGNDIESILYFEFFFIWNCQKRLIYDRAIFWQNFRFCTRNFDFLRKFWFFDKISIFDQNFDFLTKFWFFWQEFRENNDIHFYEAMKNGLKMSIFSVVSFGNEIESILYFYFFGEIVKSD